MEPLHCRQRREQAGLASTIVEKFCGAYLRERSTCHVEMFSLLPKFGVVECGPAVLQEGEDGYLFKAKNGYVIRYSATVTNRMRRRFTIAHELAHILLAEWSGESLEVCQRSFGVRSQAELQEEYFVNMIAAELLMPTSDVFTLLKGKGNGWGVVRSLASYFEVSLTAAVRRMLNLPGVVSLWTQGNRDSNQGFKAWPSCSVSSMPVDRGKMWRNLYDQKSDSNVGEAVVRTDNGIRKLVVHLMNIDCPNLEDAVWGFGWGYSDLDES